jgi:hypothetical protein
MGQQKRFLGGFRHKDLCKKVKGHSTPIFWALG